jgi:hypothetical protein
VEQLEEENEEEELKAINTLYFSNTIKKLEQGKT